MQHEIKKISRIVDELMTIMLKDNNKEIDIKVKKEPNQTIIEMIEYNTHFDNDDVDQMREILKVQRQHEIEEYYWQLAGESDYDDELCLIGSMIDEGNVEIRDNNLYIELIRRDV